MIVGSMLLPPSATLSSRSNRFSKETGLDSKYAPILSLFLGIAAGVAAQAMLPNPVWMQGVVMGTAVGLSAAGLYSGVAKFTEPKSIVIPGQAVSLAPIAPVAVPAPAPADPAPESTPPAA